MRRRRDKVDKNQTEVVDHLRSIPGITVEVGHDDILVGYKGRTHWYELKGSKATPIKPDQKRISNEFTGHYKIVYSLREILDDLKSINSP